MVYNREQYSAVHDKGPRRQVLVLSNGRIYRFWWNTTTWLIKWQKLEAGYGHYMVNCKVTHIMVF